MGGFSGSDPVPTADQLARWVEEGRVRFVLAGNEVAGAMGRTLGTAEGNAVTAERTAWVRDRCTVVDPTRYGGQDPATSPDDGAGSTLHDCAELP